MPKVAVITGANAGIGSAVASRMLTENANTWLCLACRNQTKAESVRSKLLETFPRAKIDIILCDVSNVKSVRNCCNEIRKKYNHVDLLYLNAGVMQVSGVDWTRLLKATLSIRELSYRLMTGNGLLRQYDGAPTVDGLQQTFATNLFGHFAMIQELLPVLGGMTSSQIIWTSSSNASREAFSLTDIQHKHGSEPYAASKYAVDVLSTELNKRYNSKGIYSHVTCPGLVMTNLTNGILPAWIWTLLIPLLMLFRLLAASITITPYNGAEALVWLSEQCPEQLDPRVKFYSRTSLTGHRYVRQGKLDVTEEDGAQFFAQLLQLQKSLPPS